MSAPVLGCGALAVPRRQLIHMRPDVEMDWVPKTPSSKARFSAHASGGVRCRAHKVLVPVGDGRGIAVDGDLAHRCVSEGLPQGWRNLHVVPVPDPGRFGAGIAELVNEFGDDGVRRILRLRSAELRHDTSPEFDVVRDSVDRRERLFDREKRLARKIAFPGSEGCEIFHEGGSKVVPGEHFKSRGQHDPGCVRKPLKKREDARPDVAAVQSRLRGGGAGQDVEMVGFCGREPEGASDSAENLPGPRPPKAGPRADPLPVEGRGVGRA